MSFTVHQSTGPKAAQYDELIAQARSLLSDETDHIANAANFSALVYHTLPDLNWSGFYFFDGVELVVGPFQVPLVAKDGSLVGVWDVDSPLIDRFDADDAKGMEALCRAFMELAWEPRA